MGLTGTISAKSQCFVVRWTKWNGTGPVGVSQLARKFRNGHEHPMRMVSSGEGRRIRQWERTIELAGLGILCKYR